MTQAIGWYIKVWVPKMPEKIGSIIMPGQYREQKDGAEQRGTVIAMGPDCFKSPIFNGCEPWYKIGDKVVFKSYAGYIIPHTVNDEGYERHMKESDVICIDNDFNPADKLDGITEDNLREQDGVCLLYTSDAADERSSVDLGGRR